MTNHVRIRYIFTAILLPFIWENVEAKEPQKVTQSETKFHVTLDYHYNFGLATKEKWWNNGERLGGHSLQPTGIPIPTSTPSPFMEPSVTAQLPKFRKVIFTPTSDMVASPTKPYLPDGCGT